MANMYAAPHVWNLVAKQLRQEYERCTYRDELRAIEGIAIAFAQRFQEDNGFDPIKFLDQCSPDPDRYPISELWEEFDEEHG